MNLEKGDSVTIEGGGYRVNGIIQHIKENGTITAKTGKGYLVFGGEREKYGHFEVTRILRKNKTHL